MSFARRREGAGQTPALPEIKLSWAEGSPRVRPRRSLAVMTRIAMLTFLVLVLLAPATVRAANNCPWLTQGSAETALGGKVSATVKVSNSGEGFCTFSRQEGPKDTLKVVVQKAAVGSCPAGSPELKGIGNEAVLCAMRRSPNESVEMIVSRVRELHFTIRVTTHKKGNAAGDESPNRMESVLEQLAEQVAGNLF